MFDDFDLEIQCEEFYSEEISEEQMMELFESL